MEALRISALSVVRILFCLLFPASALADLAVYHSDYRKTSDYDPGSIRVFLKNTGDSPVTIRHVLLDDIPIPVWGLTNDLGRTPLMPRPASAMGRSTQSPYQEAKASFAHKRIIWARVRPPLLQPGEVSEFVAKLQKPLARPAVVTFLDSSSGKIDEVVRPRSRALEISAITFSEGLDTAYCYVKNLSRSDVELDTLELDGVALVVGFRLSSPVVAPNEKEFVAVTRHRPFVRGAYHTFGIRTTAGASAAERIRVSSAFPLTVEMQIPVDAAAHGLDKGRPIAVFEGATMEASDVAGTNAPAADAQCVYVFGCVMHAFRADQTRVAQQIFDHHDRCAESSPAVPSSIAPCKVRPEEGYGKFGETADMLHFNPLIAAGASKRLSSESPLATVARVSEFALSGAAPRPTSAIVATHKLSDENELAGPDDVRRLAYTIVGRGVKGLIYRHRWWNALEGDAVNREIGRINREIRELRSWLVIADTFGPVASGVADVRVQGLVCPGKGLLLVAVNHGREDPLVPTMDIRLQVPGGFVPKSLRQALGDGASSEFAMTRERQLLLALPVPAAAAMWILECEDGEP